GLALMLEEPARRVVLVADRAGVVIGMVSVQLVVSTAEGAPSGWLEDLVVAEEARRDGVGRALLLAAERWARSRGATRLQLLADEENVPALRFYRRMEWAGTKLVCLRRGGALGRRHAVGGRVA
ncbi:MAG TPA: GNAT family N-acetyltransferase, partial [Anaeromyxobacteraceae bacterium]|nr:GNAT family N-acetyltransferase [Anaeromyxobacteraceae bacterium]